MKTIALANQKGGVGKTTTAASLGIGLSRQGKKVLLIDADAQGNLTQMLGWSQPDELSPTLSTLMEKVIAEKPIAPGEGILHHPSGVHLVPANIELSALEVTLVNTMSRETVLRQYLSTVADRYDYALIDCMPSLGMDNMLETLPMKEQACLEQLSNLQNQLETAKVEVQKPFPREEELKVKVARLEELNTLLDLDHKESEITDAESDEAPRPRERPAAQLER